MGFPKDFSTHLSYMRGDQEGSPTTPQGFSRALLPILTPARCLTEFTNWLNSRSLENPSYGKLGAGAGMVTGACCLPGRRGQVFVFTALGRALSKDPWGRKGQWVFSSTRLWGCSRWGGGFWGTGGGGSLWVGTGGVLFSGVGLNTS